MVNPALLGVVDPALAAVTLPGIISTNVPDSPNKLFMGGMNFFNMKKNRVQYCLF